MSGSELRLEADLMQYRVRTLDLGPDVIYVIRRTPDMCVLVVNERDVTGETAEWSGQVRERTADGRPEVPGEASDRRAFEVD